MYPFIIASRALSRCFRGIVYGITELGPVAGDPWIAGSTAAVDRPETPGTMMGSTRSETRKRDGRIRRERRGRWPR
jgi:hypothetical protein